MKKKKGLKIFIMILGVLVVLALLGYVLVNFVFSMLTDSFYDSGLGQPSQTEVQQENEPEAFDPEKAFQSLPLDKMNLSAEQFKVLAKKVSFTDKVEVLNLLRSKLTAEEYKVLTGMLSGGVTTQEIREAYGMLSKSLSTEDKETIWGYYNKYAYLLQ